MTKPFPPARQSLRYPWRSGEKIAAAELQAAVGHYYTKIRRLPTCIIVHHTRRAEMEKLLVVLKLAAVPLLTSGGCLATELWLGVPDKFDLDSLKE